MIKAVVFDYAGVIAQGPMTEWINKHLTLNDDSFISYKKYAHKWDMGEMTLDDAYNILSEITGIPPDLIWENFYEKSNANSEVTELIKKLKNKYKVILFSNFIAELLYKLLDKHDITRLFDEIIISSEHKMKKPDPAFFELMAKTAGVDKDEIIFIDDSKDNVEASNKLGIKAFLFVNGQQLIRDLLSVGVKV